MKRSGMYSFDPAEDELEVPPCGNRAGELPALGPELVQPLLAGPAFGDCSALDPVLPALHPPPAPVAAWRGGPWTGREQRPGAEGAKDLVPAEAELGQGPPGRPVGLLREPEEHVFRLDGGISRRDRGAERVLESVLRMPRERRFGSRVAMWRESGDELSKPLGRSAVRSQQPTRRLTLES